MNIVILCIRDAAGNMYNLCRAVNKYTKHKATVINYSDSKYKYPIMLENPRENLTEIRKIVYNSDAVIFKEYGKVPKTFGIELKKLGRKPVVVLFGGGGFRYEKHRRVTLETFKRLPNVRWAVTTISFLEEFPDWAWIPRCVRFEEIRGKYDYKKLKPPLITTSPSRGSIRLFKTVTLFREIVSSLKDSGLNFQSLEIHNKDNEECLRLKAPASIFFDRIGYMYGINSQEAGAFEAAVVTEMPKFALNKLKKLGFNCPFVNVTNVKETVNAFTKLLKDEKYLRRKRLECLKYVEKLHSGRESANRLIAVLEKMK